MSFDWHRVVNVVSVLFLLAGPRALAQSTGPAASAPPPQVASRDYPESPGVYVEGAGGWVELSSAIPSRARVKRAIVGAFTYGAVPTDFVAEYDGERAPAQIAPGRPVIYIYGSISLPGAPVLVRLHVNQKKGLRELDSGRMPIVGTKTAQAKQTDQVGVDVSQPEGALWSIRPKESLVPGEYALMLGRQNVSIFPFGVVVQKKESAPDGEP
jgi:hypothetical protein